MGEKSNEKDSNQGESKDKKSWLEWVVFIVSLVLVFAILGYLGYQIYTHKPSSPNLSVQSKSDPSENDPFRYHITIFNKGGVTAEEVIVELTVEKEGNTIEKSELRLPFLPQESKREAWVSFRKDPALSDTLIARIVSYKKP